MEGKLQEAISKLMPSVKGFSLEVSLGETREFFSKGVALNRSVACPHPQSLDDESDHIKPEGHETQQR